jgi:hypothetical protein
METENGGVSCAPLLPVSLGSLPRIAQCHDQRAFPEQRLPCFFSPMLWCLVFHCFEIYRKCDRSLLYARRYPFAKFESCTHKSVIMHNQKNTLILLLPLNSSPSLLLFIFPPSFSSCLSLRALTAWLLLLIDSSGFSALHRPSFILCCLFLLG